MKKRTLNDIPAKLRDLRRHVGTAPRANLCREAVDPLTGELTVADLLADMAVDLMYYCSVCGEPWEEVVRRARLQFEREHLRADALEATYTSVFDGRIVVSSGCRFDPQTRMAFDIKKVECPEAARASALTDQFVSVGGRVLRAKDGVHFDY